MLAGLFLLWFTRKRKFGTVLVSIGCLALAALSYSAFSNLLLRPLELKYPPLTDRKIPEVKWVVVLGGGQTPDAKLPVTSQLSENSLVRLLEGIRIHNHLAESKLILSGGSFSGEVALARTLADVAKTLGVKEKDMVLEETSQDTEDEAGLIEKIVEQDRFILVTSASHMPRSMALFEKRGLRPVPAPTDYHARETKFEHLGTYFPSSRGLEKVEIAVHEYLGLLWGKLRGQI